MELRVTPYTIPQAISCNYEELKAALIKKAAEYEAVVYTDDQVKVAKADRANLNRLKKALNDERIRREREYMEPFMTFKGQVNEVIGIIDKPLQAIDKQVKAFEEKQKAEKQQAIIEYWEATGAPEWLQTIKTSWLNASYSMKTIQAEIDANIEQANKDLEIIRALPAYAFEAEEHYKNTQSLAEAVREANNRQEMALRKAAYEAEQEKRKAEAATIQESQTVEPAPAAAPGREWISFRALMTVDDAKALKIFCQQRGIQIEAL